MKASVPAAILIAITCCTSYADTPPFAGNVRSQFVELAKMQVCGISLSRDFNEAQLAGMETFLRQANHYLAKGLIDDWLREAYKSDDVKNVSTDECDALSRRANAYYPRTVMSATVSSTNAQPTASHPAPIQDAPAPSSLPQSDSGFVQEHHKDDLHGIHLGASAASIFSMFSSGCQRFGPDVIACNFRESGALSHLQVGMTSHLSPQVIARVEYNFCSAESENDMMQRVVIAFGAYGLMYNQQMIYGDNNVIALIKLGQCQNDELANWYQIDIASGDIHKSDADAAKSQSTARHPTPHF